MIIFLLLLLITFTLGHLAISFLSTSRKEFLLLEIVWIIFSSFVAATFMVIFNL
jgi:hypothetical protein